MSPARPAGRSKVATVRALVPAHMMSDEALEAEMQALIDMEDVDARRWACDVPFCDGEPHAGWLHKHARWKQRPPSWWWTEWLLLTGRGWGKTKTAAETVREWANTPNLQIAVVAKNETLVREICFEHPKSGLLRVIPPEDVKAYTSSRGAITLTMKNGTEIHGFGAEVPDNLRGWAFDKAWCVAAGTPVVTERGAVPIEDVRVGDRVMTRAGWRRVTAAGVTKRDAETLRVVTAAGAVEVTAEHKVWTEERGWVRARDLTPRDTMTAWNHPPQGPQPGTSGTASAGTAAAETATTTATTVCCCTSPCGSTSTAPCRPSTTSTTSTTTERTTTCRTCCPSPGSTTSDTTSAPAPTTRTTHGSASPPTRPEQPRTACGQPASPETSSATSAAGPSSRPGCARSGAATSADAPTSGATRPASVLRVEPGRVADVYDLTVDGEHEFYAGGLLVHNCDEFAAWKRQTAQATYDMLWFCLREAESPQVVISTTPKPLPHVRKLLDKNAAQVAREQDAGVDEPHPQVVITRGHTNENMANLSVVAMGKLTEDHEGTRLGDQELGGLMLEDVEAALWQGWMFEVDNFRLDPSSPLVPYMDRRVVAVDPATTSGDNADNTGFTVAGRSTSYDATWKDGKARGYVLVSEEHRLTPEKAMRHAAMLYHRHQADAVVIEANNGGEYLSTVLRMVDPTVNVRIVNASRGKRARATPVAALYEQERVHHVGIPAAFGPLEEQMRTYIGLGDEGEKSPDLLDSLVWALWDLLLDPTLKGPGRSADERLKGRR